MSIEKMLVLSTAHVAEETAEAIDTWLAWRDVDPNERPDDPSDWVKQLILYPHGEYGWLINVVCYDPDPEALAPADLLAVFDLARSKGCDWVLLDRDASGIPNLPTYDW